MNIEELKQINHRFLNTHHSISENEVKNINNTILVIELTRDELIPKTGDTVLFTSEHGDYYGNALISRTWDNGELEICESPYTPFYCGYDNKTHNINISVSGGAFHNIKKEEFRLLREDTRKFCNWGDCGPCADGAIDFTAKVNVWEVKLNNKYSPYTTEFYNKMHIYKLDEPNANGYRILGHGMAFKNQAEYEIFLKTYRAKEFSAYGENSFIIFYYKEENFYISKEEWEQLENCQIDTRLCNCSIITVKVKYDDKNKKILVYRYSNHFEKNEEIANEPYILNRNN